MMDEEKIKRLRQKANRLPMDPGVYIMKDKSGNIIYIGKAKALKNRVTSYFRSVERHHPKVYKMVEHAEDFDYIVTDSEFEALVLECSLIKQHSPHYNILLKDDKGYHYIRVSAGDYPRITAQKQHYDDGGTYIGPYTSSLAVSQTVDEVNKIFMLPTCNRQFKAGKRERPCLNFHIKQCMAPCRGNISKEEYAEVLSQALEFISGGSQKSVAALKTRMEEAAENLEFEKAARLRDRIAAIEKINERQKVVYSKAEHEDFVAFAKSQDLTAIAVLKFRDFRLIDKVDFTLKETGDLSVLRAEFLKSYYVSQTDLPRKINLDGDCEDRELIAQLLSRQAGRRVEITTPQKGERQKLVEMAAKNAAEKIAISSAMTNSELAALDELGRLLNLPKPPLYIESYDISNLGASNIVGGMVVFYNAKPLKRAYKRFAIQSLTGPDDYGALREMLTRRFARYQTEKEEGKTEGFARLPDLILMDGGVGQVSAAQQVLDAFHLDIPLFGMVKDNSHRTRAITSSGGEIAINRNRAVFTLVSSIQDEVHRFSIQYQRQKRKSSALQMSLEKIEGVGQTRARALLKQFKTVKAISQASLEELLNTPGIDKRTAQNVYAYFHS